MSPPVKSVKRFSVWFLHDGVVSLFKPPGQTIYGFLAWVAEACCCFLLFDSGKRPWRADVTLPSPSNADIWSEHDNRSLEWRHLLFPSLLLPGFEKQIRHEWAFVTCCCRALRSWTKEIRTWAVQPIHEVLSILKYCRVHQFILAMVKVTSFRCSSLARQERWRHIHHYDQHAERPSRAGIFQGMRQVCFSDALCEAEEKFRLIGFIMQKSSVACHSWWKPHSSAKHFKFSLASVTWNLWKQNSGYAHEKRLYGRTTNEFYSKFASCAFLRENGWGWLAGPPALCKEDLELEQASHEMDCFISPSTIFVPSLETPHVGRNRKPFLSENCKSGLWLSLTKWTGRHWSSDSQRDCWVWSSSSSLASLRKRLSQFSTV